MRGYFIGFFVGIIISLLGQQLKYVHVIKERFDVGACLSNGLFYEQVREVRKTTLGKVYVLDGFINGKRLAPSTTDTWIVDDKYVEINRANCKEHK